MGYKTRLVAGLIAFVGFGVIAAAGFGYWYVSLASGDASGQIFGITVGGIFFVMWLGFVLVAADDGNTYRRPTSYRY